MNIFMSDKERHSKLGTIVMLTEGNEDFIKYEHAFTDGTYIYALLKQPDGTYRPYKYEVKKSIRCIDSINDKKFNPKMWDGIEFNMIYN